ncbi:hypothetical protein [Longimicrobium sp.]|uniref:hypothetical protein n=1 Tax=Longimicrobium sp. TaxID=2029185 RepID=UPI003B3A6C42
MDEIDRDPALAAALRGMDDAPEPDWSALRAQVTAAAELPLARRRRTLSIRRGMRAIVPLAAAAGIAAIALGGLERREPALSQEERAVVDEILTLSTPDQVGLLMTGEAAEQALLEAVEDGRE